MMGLEWLKPGVFFGSILYALVGVGEPEEVRAELRRVMRTMIQRARDAA